MNNKNIWIILTVGLIIGGFAFATVDSRAEKYDMEKECYKNMSQKQVVVCLKSMKVAVEEMTKELMTNIKPVKVES